MLKCLVFLSKNPATSVVGGSIITSIKYRKKVIEKLKNDSLSIYWKIELKESLKENPSFESSLNWQISKLKRLMGNKILSPILFQKSSVNISEVINNGGVILCRISRNDIGFENVSIISSIFIFKVQMAGMQRIMIPSEQRNSVFFYINDFHYFTQNQNSVKTLAEFLSEGRLYKMGLIINHPFADQVASESLNFLFQAILNNCATSITFKSSTYDAKIWEHYLFDNENRSLYTQQNIFNLKNNEFIGRTLLGDGVPSKPFLAEIISFEHETKWRTP